jgi:hypothetical protein
VFFLDFSFYRTYQELAGERFKEPPKTLDF